MFNHVVRIFEQLSSGEDCHAQKTRKDPFKSSFVRICDQAWCNSLRSQPTRLKQGTLDSCVRRSGLGGGLQEGISALSDDSIYSGLKQLGQATPIPSTPEEAVLERVRNPQTDVRYSVRFTAPEFTSLCPMTGQPDFAHLVIDYVPKEWLVESKSLKLYLTSFRNHGAFHEDCTVSIGRRLVDLLEPEWLRIGGYWYPRGGIPIDVFFQTSAMPSDLWIPDQGVPTYRGRG